MPIIVRIIQAVVTVSTCGSGTTTGSMAITLTIAGCAHKEVLRGVLCVAT